MSTIISALPRSEHETDIRIAALRSRLLHMTSAPAVAAAGFGVVTAPSWPVHHPEVSTVQTTTTTKTTKKMQIGKLAAKAKYKIASRGQRASAA